MKVYQCTKCNEHFDEWFYNYTPATCPKHQWEFDRWGFYDDPWKHEVYWIMKCDRCGAKYHKRWDSREVGLREAVQVEDPRVLPLLDFNEHTARFHLDEDDIKNFWE